jgi:hypothetical protein
MTQPPADASGSTEAHPDPQKLEILLRRFGEALGVVIDGLAQLDGGAAAEHAPRQGAVEPNAGPMPRGDELADLLTGNNMRAEKVIAEIRAAWQGAEPAWLATAARAIGALDYPGALATLRAAGAIGPAT